MVITLVDEKTQDGQVKMSAAVLPSPPQSEMEVFCQPPEVSPPKEKASGMDARFEQEKLDEDAPLDEATVGGDEEEKMRMRTPVQAAPDIREAAAIDTGRVRSVANVAASSSERDATEMVLSSLRRIISTRARQLMVMKPAIVKRPPNTEGLVVMASPSFIEFRTENRSTAWKHFLREAKLQRP